MAHVDSLSMSRLVANGVAGAFFLPNICAKDILSPAKPLNFGVRGGRSENP
jgi:hypothetical protein